MNYFFPSFFKKIRLEFSIILFFFFFCRPAQAEDSLGSWNILNLKLNFNEKISLIGEGQLRSLGFYHNFHYYEYKAIINYNLDKNFTASLGTGKYNTYSEGGNFKLPLRSDEIRTFFQLTMKQLLDPLKFDHRYRIEQRFTTRGYRNRFRYRLNLTVPLNGRKIEQGVFYLNASDEIFMTNLSPYFERNRFFFGIGYQLTDNLILQSGYLNQFDFNLNDETGKDFLQISLQYEFDLNDLVKVDHLPNAE